MVVEAGSGLALMVPGMPGRLFFFFNVLFYLFICHVTYGILVPQPGIEPNPPALGAWSLDHWSTRGVPREALECCHVYGTDPATEKAHQRCAE